MAESWREACWRAEQEVAEYKETIVPAIMRNLRIAERERDAANRMLMRMEKELEFTRQFIHDQGLEFALASAWEAKNKGEAGERI